MPILMLVTEPSPKKEAIVSAAVQGGVNLIYQRSESEEYGKRFPKLALRMGWGRGGEIIDATSPRLLKLR